MLLLLVRQICMRSLWEIKWMCEHRFSPALKEELPVELRRRMQSVWLNYLWYHLLWNRSPRRRQWPQAGHVRGQLCFHECATQLFLARLHPCQSLWEPRLSSGRFLAGPGPAPTLALFGLVSWFHFYCFPFSSFHSKLQGKRFSLISLYFNGN